MQQDPYHEISPCARQFGVVWFLLAWDFLCPTFWKKELRSRCPSHTNTSPCSASCSFWSWPATGWLVFGRWPWSWWMRSTLNGSMRLSLQIFRSASSLVSRLSVTCPNPQKMDATPLGHFCFSFFWGIMLYKDSSGSGLSESMTQTAHSASDRYLHRLVLLLLLHYDISGLGLLKDIFYF